MKKLLVHILSVVVTTVFAQAPATLSIYTTQQGLPSNSIRGLAIDNNRQLWVSTDNGLYQFSNLYGADNGKHLFQEKKGVADNQHICSNDLNMVYADRYQPILWIATRASGLDAYHYDEERFVHYHPITVSGGRGRTTETCTGSPYLPDGSVTSIAPWKEHILWMTSYQAGFCSMDKRTGLFNHYHYTTVTGMPNDSLWCILPLDDNTLAVGHTNAGISIIDLRKRRASNYPVCWSFSEKYVAEDGVRTMIIDNHRNLWLGTEKGLALFDMKSRKAREIRGIRGLVTHLSVTGDTLYICTRDMGLCSLSLSETYRTAYSPKISHIDMSQAGLSSSVPVTICLADNNGHRYVGTLEEGLILQRKHAPYISALNLPKEIKGNVTSLLAVTQEDIWIGTYQNGLYRWNLRSGKCHNLNLVDADGGKRIFVNALTLWRGHVMVATGQGLFAVTPKDESYKCYTKNGGGLSTNYIVTLAVDSYQRLWCGSTYGNIDIIDTTFHRVYTNSTKQMGINHAMLHFATIGKDTMAATNGNGLILLKYSEKTEPEILRLPTADSTLLSSLTVKTMLVDRQGKLLLFTPVGVMGLGNGELISLYPCKETDLLANCNAATLMPDGEIMWFANRKLGLISQRPTTVATSRFAKYSPWLTFAASILLLLAGGYTIWRKRKSYNQHHNDTAETAKETEETVKNPEEPNAFLEKLNEKVNSLDSLASLNRDSLAEEMCMSKSTLYRRMKQELGKSPNEWIRVKRLERAHMLLAKGLNVSETADRVGLDPAYLARCYKEQYGVYPSEMKK